LADKTAYINGVPTFQAHLNALHRELDRTAAFRGAWVAAAPASSDLSPVFAQIHQSVRGTGAEVIRWEPQTAVPRQRLRQVPVQMHSLGAFPQIMQSLVAVEKLDTTVWIDDVKITQPREAGQKTQCEVKLVIFAAGAEFSEESDGSVVR
jgi:Tfp pilus assembly protein PilO